MSYTEAITTAKDFLGSWRAVGQVCGGISGEAARLWALNGYPPRTEYTGETNYASAISKATGGAVRRKDLLPSRCSA